jgi:hypothetical protein
MKEQPEKPTDPRVGKLTPEDAAKLKQLAQEMGGLDSMPAWMRDEIETKSKLRELIEDVRKVQIPVPDLAWEKCPHHVLRNYSCALCERVWKDLKSFPPTTDTERLDWLLKYCFVRFLLRSRVLNTRAEIDEVMGREGK